MQRYSRWEDAMVAQARIAEWYATTEGQMFLHAFFEDMNRREGSRALDPRLTAHIQQRTITEGEPIWVSHDMSELVDHARETWRLEPVRKDDPFVPCGFALFARPLMLHDAPVVPSRPLRSPSGLVPVRAMSWIPLHSEDLDSGCYWISYYVHIDDELDLDPEDRHIKELPSSEYADVIRSRFPLSLAHQWQWTWGADVLDPRYALNMEVVEGEEAEATIERGRQQAALVQTLWRLGSQFRPVRSVPQRGFRRDARRKGLDHEHVNVMVLRRTRPSKVSDEPSDRKLTVRHIVRGFWTTRHTRNGPKQVWINPYLRGGDDLEFQPSTRAWEFRR